MPVLTVTLNIDDNPWTDLKREDLIHIKEPFRIGALPGGMTSGKASVAIAVFLPDGRPVIVETSMDLFLTAAAALRARYGENAPRGSDA
jgi:hypothetical protein